MDCKEAIYSDMVVDYIISNYKSEDNLMGEYATDCYQLLDGDMAVIYREEASITGQTIRQYGYLAVPKCYGLLDQSALEASGVLRLRRQPAFDLLGRCVMATHLQAFDMVASLPIRRLPMRCRQKIRL